MIEIFRILLPTIALLYYLIKGAKCKIFLLGIPFVIYMGISIMFSAHLTGIFNRPYSIDSELRLFFWLFVVWVISRKPNYKYRRNVYSKLIRFAELFLYLILVFVAIHTVIALTQRGSLLVIYYNAREPIYMVLGYFMIKRILLSFSRENVNRLITSIIALSTICMLVFVMHQGLGIKIYPYAEYSTFTYLQVEMTRSFGIISPLILAICAYSLVTVSYKRSSVFLLILAVSVILVSYTRGMVLIGIVMLLGNVVINVSKRSSMKKVWTYLIFPLIVVVIGLSSFKFIMPKQFGFLGTRIVEVTDAFSGYGDNSVGNITHVSTVNVRKDQMEELYLKASIFQRVFGNGYSQEMAGTIPLMTNIYDSEWQALFIQFGILGMLIFSIVQGVFLLLAIRMGKSVYSEKAIFGIVIALLILGNFVWAFSSVTYFLYYGVALSFWPFAFLVSEAQRSNQTINGCSDNNN